MDLLIEDSSYHLLLSAWYTSVLSKAMLTGSYMLPNEDSGSLAKSG